MTLEELKSIVCTVGAYQWCGRTIHLRKLGAKDHIALFSAIKSDAGKELSPQEDHDAVLRHHVEMTARTLADEQGNLISDSDEGRKYLASLPFDDLVSLGVLVMSHSGYTTEPEKKS